MFAIHLWNEMWRFHGQDKNACYPPGCAYTWLREMYSDKELT
jgi:hypothetical protein